MHKLFVSPVWLKAITIYHYVAAVLLLNFALLNYEVLKGFFNSDYLKFTESFVAKIAEILFSISLPFSINYWAVAAELFALLQSTLIFTLVNIGLAILYFLAGRGLLHGKVWAPNLAKLLSGLLILIILFVVIQSMRFGGWSTLTELVWGITGLIFQGLVWSYLVFSKKLMAT